MNVTVPYEWTHDLGPSATLTVPTSSFGIKASTTSSCPSETIFGTPQVSLEYKRNHSVPADSVNSLSAVKSLGVMGTERTVET